MHPAYPASPLAERFGLVHPVINAGMALIARPALASAVSNAGGLGMLGADMTPPEGVRAMIRETRALTERPFGVDFLTPFTTEAHIDVAVEEGIALAVFFWGLPTPAQVERLQSAAIDVWVQIATLEEAQDAAALGVDALIVQGAEGGGHNRSSVGSMALLPAVRRAVAPTPVVAAGGVADGEGLVAAFALGAEAVWCGTRFLMAAEADAHPDYQARVARAGVGETLSTTLFGPEWPSAPMRVLRNAATDEWADRPAEAHAATAGETVATVRTPAGPHPLPRFSIHLPTRAVEGDLEQLCLTAGESAGLIGAVKPAADILADMARETAETLARLAGARPSAAAA